MSVANTADSTQLIRLVDSHQCSVWKNSVWDLLDTAYRNVAGGLHFASPDAMLDETQEWEILHDSGQILAALLYKHKHGRKIIAFGVTEQECRRHEVISTLGEIIRHRLTDAWIEVSERAESFVLRNGGDHRRIPNRYASQLTGKSILSLKDDGFHYVREICGIRKQKLIVGTPRISLQQNSRIEKHENRTGRKSFQCIASCH
ncbi:MAG: hypothetical protein PHW13_07335 [Methylococcales bacterium]|nr:hypothetical protein [Methylococcales bacterium]